MAVNLYETRTMLRILEESKPARRFLLDTFFSDVETSTTEHVDIDVIVGQRRMAPFVSPLSEGKVVEKIGYTTRTFKPPYLKPKFVVDAEDLTDRMPGNIIYTPGSSPAERTARKLGELLAEGREMVVRRCEWMAANALNTGTITVTGEGLSATIDFSMPAGNKITLTGGDLWTDTANSDPLKNLRTWRRQIAQSAGVSPDIAIIGTSVTDALLAHDDVRTLLDNRRIQVGNIDFRNYNELGVSYIGNIQGLDIVEYAEWYLDSSGTEQPMVPVDKVLLGSTMARTAQHYGLIRDVEAGDAAVQIFPKSWTQPDPSVRYLLLQSAPLVALHQSNAFISAKVV